MCLIKTVKFGYLLIKLKNYSFTKLIISTYDDRQIMI